jgi:hypothetical protein
MFTLKVTLKNKKIVFKLVKYTSIDSYLTFNDWNTWTSTSYNIPFESSDKQYGDGEEKLGAEYDTAPLGQNSSYDLNIFGKRFECKKLDKDGSFRLGVEVSSMYNDTLTHISNIFNKIKTIIPYMTESLIKTKLQSILNDIEKTSAKCKTSVYNGFKKHEVSESNLELANILLEKLKVLITFDISEKFTLYCSITGHKKEYNLINTVKKLNSEDLDANQKEEIIGNAEKYNSATIYLKLFEDLSYFYDKTLKDVLNDIVRSVFIDKILVFVHENNGYKPISELNRIICYRITSGSPRCKYL